MKGREVILGAVSGREAAALIVDGALDDLLIDSDAPRPGTIYRARVDRPVKGQGGVFLSSPDGSLFLRHTKGLAPGDTLLVQVSGYAEPGKAIPVTARLLFKSRYAIVTPDAPGMNISRSIRDDEVRGYVRAAAETEKAEATAHGLILRSAAADAEADDIAEDVDTMLALADQILGDEGQDVETLLEGEGPHALAWRDWQADQAREGDLADWLSDALDHQVALGAQARMYVEPTRALVAVDVNTGADTSPASGLKANLAAMQALPRALRVRGLGGQIVIDLAPSAKKDRKTIEAALRRALKSDMIETSLVGWTPLGHIELSRKRARPVLSQVIAKDVL